MRPRKRRKTIARVARGMNITMDTNMIKILMRTKKISLSRVERRRRVAKKGLRHRKSSKNASSNDILSEYLIKASFPF